MNKTTIKNCPICGTTEWIHDNIIDDELLNKERHDVSCGYCGYKYVLYIISRGRDL